MNNFFKDEQTVQINKLYNLTDRTKVPNDGQLIGTNKYEQTLQRHSTKE